MLRFLRQRQCEQAAAAAEHMLGVMLTTTASSAVSSLGEALSSLGAQLPVPSNNLIRRFYDHTRRGQFPKLFAKFDS